MSLKALQAALFCAGVCLVVSCSTAPQRPRIPGEAAQWLGGQPQIVVRIDTKAVTAWSAVVKTHPDLSALGGRTRVVWAGFDLASLDGWKNAASSVRLVLEGDFPKGLVGFALDWNNRWQKGAEKGLWTNQKLDLTVEVPQDDLVAVRRHHPDAFDESPHVLRGLGPQPMEASSLWLTFWDPGEVLFGPQAGKLLPVERLDLSLHAVDDRLEGQVILYFFDERAARAATVLLKLFSPVIQQRFGQSLTWAAQGTSLVGSGLNWKQSDVNTLAQTLVAGTLPSETRSGEPAP